MSQIDRRAMHELADAAFRQAAKKVIEKAIQTKTPVIVWENGAIKKIEVTSETAIETVINSKEEDASR